MSQFFEPPPPAAEGFDEVAGEDVRLWQAPSDVLPGLVSLQFVLARSASAAVLVQSIAAYPQGFSFGLEVFWREAKDRELVGFFDPETAEDFRFGILFADGRRATTDAPGSAEGPVLVEGGGGGGDRSYDSDFWVWPLPPPGQLAFICEWRAESIPETRLDVDAAPILEAAARAETGW